MINWIANIGATTIARVAATGRAGLMLFGAIFALPQFKNIRLTIHQMYVELMTFLY